MDNSLALERNLYFLQNDFLMIVSDFLVVPKCLSILSGIPSIASILLIINKVRENAHNQDMQSISLYITKRKGQHFDI